jgi:hypothetical protein
MLPWQKRLQELPHTIPLLAAVVCIVLQALPIQDSLRTPIFFPWSFLFTLAAAVGFVLIELGNDYVYGRHGLLPPQGRRTIIWVGLIGTFVAFARILHIFVLSKEEHWSTEHLQRIFIGIPYFVTRNFGLDMWGWAFGFFCFALFITGGFFALMLFNCCGRVRLVQSTLRRVNSPHPTSAPPHLRPASLKVPAPFLPVHLW